MNPKIEYEVERTPDEPQVDTVWVRDGRGHFVKLEVEDDAPND